EARSPCPLRTRDLEFCTRWTPRPSVSRNLQQGCSRQGNPMKVSIIGGGGLVGSMTAYALQCGGVVSSICLIDANKDMALGQATDLLHGASLVADQRITAGDMGDIPSSNVVVITAGLRRKPD